jgi:hypothetical protein
MREALRQKDTISGAKVNWLELTARHNARGKLFLPKQLEMSYVKI